MNQKSITQRGEKFFRNFLPFWRRFRKDRLAVVGLVILLCLTLIAIISPCAGFSPYALADKPLLPPSSKHLFGTDSLGRDIFSQVLSGINVSMFVAVGAALVALILGVLIGAIAGYVGGIVDILLMRATEIFMVAPRLILAIVVAAIFGPSVWNLIFVIGALSWPENARLIRAMFLSLKERQFVLAARSLGASEFSIIFKEILPNALFVIVTNTTFLVAYAMIVESGLSFLGLGDPNNISLGYILKNSQPYFRTAPWFAAFPGAVLFLITVSINIVGDGLNEALRPRSLQ